MSLFSPKRIYLDYASTTPVAESVRKAMQPYLSDVFFNPSSIYKEGVAAKKVLDGARAKVATYINCRAEDIIFTSGGTEANNLAILGVVRKAKESIATPHIITTAIEHPSVKEVFLQAEKEGAKVTYLPVNEEGLVNPQELKAALTSDTVLVSIIYVNNEIGVIQPVKELGRSIKLWKIDHKREPQQYPYFHVDAAQAPAYCSIDREPQGIDMMTLDASKIYGPKGVGVLYSKSYIPLQPLTFGGGQEKGLRSGTESLSLIIGMVEALAYVSAQKEKEVLRLGNLQTYFFDQIKNKLPQATVNGSRTARVPNNINICIPGINAEFVVLQLDAKGIACSFATSCKNLNDDSSSYVVSALHKECGASSLRFTMGIGTSTKDIDYTIKALVEVLKI